jgi:hypothetical protein
VDIDFGDAALTGCERIEGLFETERVGIHERQPRRCSAETDDERALSGRENQ